MIGTNTTLAGTSSAISSLSSSLGLHMSGMNINIPISITGSARTKPSNSSNMPILINNSNNSNKLNLLGRKNEIYVDVIEKLAVLFNSHGYLVNSSIDGCIMMKSFLAGNPELHLALNEDLIIGRGSKIVI